MIVTLQTIDLNQPNQISIPHLGDTQVHKTKVLSICSHYSSAL